MSSDVPASLAVYTCHRAVILFKIFLYVSYCIAAIYITIKWGLFYLVWCPIGVNMSTWWMFWWSSNKWSLSGFLILLPDLMVAKVPQFWVWLLCSYHLFYFPSALFAHAFCVCMFVQLPYMWDVLVYTASFLHSVLWYWLLLWSM